MFGVAFPAVATKPAQSRRLPAKRQAPVTILTEAEQVVHGDRDQDFGGVRGSFDRIALSWTAILGTDVSAEQVAMCMMSLKMVRESYRHQRDNLVDVAGYALCLQQLEENPLEEFVD